MENFELQPKPEKSEQLENSIRELNKSTKKEIENATQSEKENPTTEKVLEIFRAYKDKISEIARDMAKIYKE